MEDPVTSTVNSVFMEELDRKKEEFIFHIKNAFACLPGENCCKCATCIPDEKCNLGKWNDLPKESKEYFLNNYPNIFISFMNFKTVIESVTKPSKICNVYRNAEINRLFVTKLSKEFEKEVFKTYENFNKSMITYVETKEK